MRIELLNGIGMILFSTMRRLKRTPKLAFRVGLPWVTTSNRTLFFDDIPGNTNGKMSLKVYRDQTLEHVVRPWLLEVQDFVLEKDDDTSASASMKRKDNNLEYFFNCASSPDPSPIENCSLPPKQHLADYLHWDYNTTKELILEVWAQVSQELINERCGLIPNRLRDVIDGEGKMTGY